MKIIERVVIMKKNKITLREAAKIIGISPTTIYNYIKKGLLPKPERVPNLEEGRGTKAIYDKDIIKKIQQIRSKLDSTHSLNNIIKDLEIPDQKKKRKMLVTIEKIKKLVSQGIFKGERFNKEVSSLNELSRARATTAIF